MNPFPFSADDWNKMEATSWELTNAVSMDDAVLIATNRERLLELFHEMRSKYGTHPILLELEADFSMHDRRRQRELYVSAIDIATTNSIDASSIRVSLARLLLDEFDDKSGAREQLLGCREQIHHIGDDWEKQEWQELFERCEIW